MGDPAAPRIDTGEGNATVLLGSSRLYFDVQLPVWERLAGKAPIQLSYEGTSPLTAIEDLAADPKFTGRLLVGVAPDLFFSGVAGAADAVAAYTHKESPGAARRPLAVHAPGRAVSSLR